MGFCRKNIHRARVLALALAAYLCVGCAGVHHAPAAPDTIRADYTTFAGDHTLGERNAPVILIQYDSPTCHHCAATLADSFPHIKAEYIDTGKLFYVYRVFPLERLDVQIDSVARCLPPEKYLSFMATVLQQQEKWNPYYGVKDARQGLAQLAYNAGLSDQDFNRCFTDVAILDGVKQEDNAASLPFRIDGAPTFVINGEIGLGNHGWPPLRDKIEAALAKSRPE